ncbi:hypothetical protein EIN_223660 [Entamoeba invadens IP1]|uniref:PH domain-containing protein n=1 Tax=Entamoeba invadens IP1 TaxID=370355 RepID=A0A0A1U852_ENTIV|nr:hypothetical protein EIN_223660 [Entamoeba invadens IP1]ELP88153.1 hypothetical protein EIN_223660 [Entamoeba invadens IP1]|eukprot:XP_004254924.1 hypothetical protein EIN_223660 [Entamoeba invadens IP1]
MTERKTTVSVQSLQPSQFSGWGTKQGGKWKTWKRRFFVLKDRKLWYFEAPDSLSAKGWIDLPPGTDVKDESDRPKRLAFSINSRGVKGIRTFHLTVDTENDLVAFLDGLNKVLGNVKSKKREDTLIDEHSLFKMANSFTTGNATDNILVLRSKVQWLNNGQIASLLECAVTALPEDKTTIDFSVSINSDLSAVGLRFAGEQGPMLQSVVDTFWAVGTPASEIERLNLTGVRIDPKNLGMWLDLSKRGGMDGGWFMITDHTPTIVNLISDGGKINDKVTMLMGINNIKTIDFVGRDLGVTPPRQANYRFKIDGHDRATIVKDFYEKCNLKGFNLLIQKIINDAPNREVYVSVKTTNIDLVKITTILESPTPEMLQDAVQLVKGFYVDSHNELIQAFGNPIALEISVLRYGYGYDVFNEGLDVSLVYNLQDDNITTFPFKKSPHPAPSKSKVKDDNSKQPVAKQEVNEDQVGHLYDQELQPLALPEKSERSPRAKEVTSIMTVKDIGQSVAKEIGPISPKEPVEGSDVPPPVPPLSPRRTAHSEKPTGSAPLPPKKPAPKPGLKKNHSALQINPPII